MQRNSLASNAIVEGFGKMSLENTSAGTIEASQGTWSMSASLHAPVSSSPLQKRFLNEAAASKPTLLGIPQELRNKIFSYIYNTSGPVARSIGLDLSSSRRHRWSDECCELTGYFYYLPQELCPPTKLPLLVCKQLRAEMSKMQRAAFRNYWTANTFRIELCDSLFGGNDHITEEQLRHIHHIAYRSKRLCNEVTLHYIFTESWNFAVELSGPKAGGRMVSVSDLRGYQRLDELEELSKLPAELEQIYRDKDGPLDPSAGQGFSFLELVVFLEALDEIDHTFKDLATYCCSVSLV